MVRRKKSYVSIKDEASHAWLNININININSIQSWSRDCGYEILCPDIFREKGSHSEVLENSNQDAKL